MIQIDEFFFFFTKLDMIHMTQIIKVSIYVHVCELSKSAISPRATATPPPCVILLLTSGSSWKNVPKKEYLITYGYKNITLIKILHF